MNTGTYSSAKEKSDEMAAILRDISLLIGQERDVSVNLETGGAVVCGLGFMSNAHSLSVRAQDIQQGIFKIIVLGEFKHGKSTLLNAMLGGRVLAAKATPCTAIVTMLVYGDSNNVSVYESGHDSPRVMSLESFTSEYQLTREDQETLNQQGYIDRFQKIDYAQINCQHSLCANGVRLIDSPGLKESSSRTKVTTRFLKQAQAIIFVLNATQIISTDERQFIAETLGKGRLTNVFFVVNKINMVDEFEVDDIKKYVKLGLEDCFIDEEGHFDQNLYDRRVFYVDAKGALSARSVDPINSSQLENSGVLRLEIELEAFLASDEKISAYFESSIQSLSWIIPDVHTTVRQRKQTLEVPLLELEQKSKEVEQRLIGLESRKGILDRTLQVYISKISAIAANSLREHTGKMRQTWKLDSQNLNLEEMFGFSLESITDFVKLIANNSETKKKINQILERELKAYSEIKFKEWSDQLPELLSPEIERMVNEAELQTKEFDLELTTIRNLFFEIPITAEDTLNLERNMGAKSWQTYIGLAMGDVSQVTGTLMGKGDLEGFLKRIVSQLAMITIASNVVPIVGPIVTIIGFIVVEGIIIAFQRDNLRLKILEEIGKNFFEQLDGKMSEISLPLDREIQKNLSKMMNPLIQKKQSEIDELRQSRDKILSQKRDVTFSVDKEQSRLDTIETKINQLFARVCELTYGKQLTRQEMQKLTEGKTLINQ